MCKLSLLIPAHPTSVAMVKVVLATNTTNATLVTVINALLVSKIIVQVADITKVHCKVLPAALAGFAFGLLQVASEALDVSHFMPFEFVV